MELTNEFRVAVPIAAAWDVLTDVERIAPCMPGAQLQEVAGDEYRGIVKVKVGPITAQYKGSATFVEQDKDAGRAVLRAEGRDTRGQGNASALITATLSADGEGTNVKVVTDLTVTGRVAQFGRGVLADVSTKLLGQFVDCLERDLLTSGNGEVSQADGSEGSDGDAASPNGSSSRAPTGSASSAAATATETAVSAGTEAPASTAPAAGEPRRIDSPVPKPVDLLDAAGMPVAKRLIPVAGVLAILFLLWRRRGRR